MNEDEDKENLVEKIMSEDEDEPEKPVQENKGI